jgi:UDP-N-acetylmuramoyl-tripeptide--D-alanyl-D-alanine ligase
MNELGSYTQQAHEQVGRYCDPKKLDLVVTVGRDAKKWLAPAAEQVGCKVESCDDPISAGKFVRKKLKPKALVLAKGSQNGVFLEEAVKLLLASSGDSGKLVRQGDYWLKIKKDLLAK